MTCCIYSKVVNNQLAGVYRWKSAIEPKAAPNVLLLSHSLLMGITHNITTQQALQTNNVLHFYYYIPNTGWSYFLIHQHKDIDQKQPEGSVIELEEARGVQRAGLSRCQRPQQVCYLSHTNTFTFPHNSVQCHLPYLSLSIEAMHSANTHII